MANKRVEFNAVDNGVSQMMQRLRQQSEQMSRELIQDAQQYTQSGKEQVRYIEDQIKAIERRNQLEKEQRQLVAQQTRQQKEQQATTSGEAQQAREQYQEQIQQIQVESKEDEMQTKLLRELIEVTKQTAQEEIRADKQDTRREIRSTERAMQRGDDVDPEEAFKRTYQKEQLGTEREEVAEEERRFRGTVQQAGRTAGGVAGMGASGSESALLAGGVGAVLGVGAGALVNRYFQAGSQYEQERLSARAMMGRDFMGGEDRRQRMLGMTDLGVTGTETYQFGTQLARQRGGAESGMVGESLRDAVSGLTALQELYGVDQQTIMQRAGVERGDVSRQGTFRDVESMVAALQQSGLLEGQDRTRVDELINIQTQFLQQQRQFRETTDAGRVSALMSDMGRVGGSFADDRMIQQMQGMDQALRSPQNEFAEAFQLSALRQQNPGMNPFQLRRQQEKGIMAEGYLNQAMGNIMQMPGSDWMKKEQMFNMFGGNISRDATQQLFQSFQGDKDLFTDFTSRAQELRGQGMGREEAMRKAEEEALGTRQKQEARVSFSVEEAGEEMFQQIDKMFGDSSPIAGWNDMIKDGIETMGKFTGAIGESIKTVKDAQKSGIIGGTGKMGNEDYIPDESSNN